MTRLRRVPFFWLLVFLISGLLLLAGGRLAPQDEETTYRTTANLIEYGRWTITAQTFTVEPQSFPGFLPHSGPRELLTTWAVPGRDGQLYPQFSPGQSLVAIPWYLLGRLLGGAPSLPAVLITRFTTSLFNPMVIALTGWLIALFAVRLGFSARLSSWLGVTYALGSMALPYTGTYFGEPLIALTITLAAYALHRAKADRVEAGRWLLVSGTALALAALTRERSVIMIPAFGLYALPIIRRQWRRGLIWLLPLLIVGGFIGLLNASRYGSPLTFGFSALQHTTFSTPILLGLYGLLLSPGKGLLVYTPLAWLGLIGLWSMRRRWRSEAVLFALTIAAELGFFAGYEFWTGGWNWGPRYILPIVPLLILAAGAWVHSQPTGLRRMLVIVLSAVGLLVNLPAALVDHSRYLVEFGERDPAHYLDRSILNFADSPVTQQWPVVLALVGQYTRPETWQAAQQAVTEHLNNYQGDGSFESLSTHALWFDEFFRLNVPDFWFVHLWLLGVSPPLIGLMLLALLIGLGVSARRIWLLLR